MLSPSTLERLPDGLTDLVNELQTEIIKAAAKKITKANYLTPSGEWLMYKAQMLQSGTNEVNRLISRYTGLSRREVKSLYTDSCMKAIANDAKIYRMAGKDASSFFRSVAFSNALKAGIRNANGLMNNITRSMVQSNRSTVTHLMDKAYVMVLSGAFSQSEAIYSAVKELADKGIRSVTYPSGKSDWADVAVRRAVLTGIGQTTGRMQLDLAAEMDSDLVEVTSHSGARPSHAEWQGKVYSISGKSKKYPPLSRTGYGTGDGLKGWNCRHDFYPFFEGISERASFLVDIAENQKEYEAAQRQRAIERSIRSSKRGLAALDSAIQSTDDDELKAKLQRQFDRKANTLKNQEARLAEHCKSSGLLPRPDRTRVVGFGRSVGQKAVHGNKRYANAHSQGSKYRRILLDTENPIVATRVKDFSLNRVTTAVNNIFISEGVQIKPKRFHEIDKKITEVFNLMKLSGNNNLPAVYLISPEEMGTYTAASYNAVQNVLYINEGWALYSADEAPELLNNFACYKDDRSTYVHELFHWKDAETYRKKFGTITKDNISEYNKWIDTKCKKKLDKLTSKGYNIGDVSKYAKQKYFNSDFAEPYTEYRTKKLLEGG